MAYDAEWYASLAEFRQWNEQAFWAILAHLGRPKSYLDVGCGDGWMVRTARMAGCKPSIGIEGSLEVRRVADRWARVAVHDLTQPLSLQWKFDLVTSIEVGEHLPFEASETFIKSLTSHATNWLVFTAAIPGQGGHGHINCQPPEYWRELIEREGLAYDATTTEHLRETWKWVTGPMFWLPQNLQVFKR